MFNVLRRLAPRGGGSARRIERSWDDKAVFGVIMTPAVDAALTRAIEARTPFAVCTFAAVDGGFEFKIAGERVFVDFAAAPLPIFNLLAVVHGGGVPAHTLVRHLEGYPRPILSLEVKGEFGDAEKDWLQERMSDRLRQIWCMAERANIRAASLRRSIEQTERNFRRLRRYCDLYGLDRIVRIFETQPVKDDAEPTRPPVRLRLPVQSLGVCRIDLLVEAQPAAPTVDTLTITLKALEIGADLHVWHLDETACEGEWTTLRLPSGLAESDLTLELDFAYSARMSQWRLAPSGLWLSEDGELTAGLAIRIFAGIPDLGFSENVQDATSNRISISGRDLDGAELISPRPAGVEFDIVDYIDDLGGLFIHPTAGGPTIAVLENPCAKGSREIVLHLRHAHPQGDPFLVTLQASSRRLSPADFPISRQSEANGQSLELGQWSRINGGDYVRLSFNLAETTGAELLHVATLPAEGEAANNSWAILQQVDCIV